MVKTTEEAERNENREKYAGSSKWPPAANRLIFSNAEMKFAVKERERGPRYEGSVRRTREGGWGSAVMYIRELEHLTIVLNGVSGRGLKYQREGGEVPKRGG